VWAPNKCFDQKRVHPSSRNAFGTSGERCETLLGAIALALDFQTWRTLVRQQGLTQDRVSELMVGMAISPAYSTAQSLERVMNLGENRIGMRITRSAWFPRDFRFPHS